jgi:hypothetical protein
MNGDQAWAATDAVAHWKSPCSSTGRPADCAWSRVTLLDALRGYAGLTGTKKGGEHGQCGACTVLIDGRRINSA